MIETAIVSIENAPDYSGGSMAEYKFIQELKGRYPELACLDNAFV